MAGEKNTNTHRYNPGCDPFYSGNKFSCYYVSIFFRKIIMKTARECNRKRNETLQVFFMMFSHAKRKISHTIIRFLRRCSKYIVSIPMTH